MGKLILSSIQNARLKERSSEWQTLLSALTTSTEALRSLTEAGLYKLDAEDLQTLASLAKTMGYVRMHECVSTGFPLTATP